MERFKRIAVLVLGRAIETFGAALAEQQEVLMHAADLLIDTYAAESAALRASASSVALSARASLHHDAARVFVNDAARSIDASARQALAATLEGEALARALGELDRLSDTTPINTAVLRRRLSAAAVERAAYPFA